LQRPFGDRVKTDVRDTRHLARLLHLGEIVAVTVTSVEQEAARDLVRAREDVRGNLMSARHRLSKLLLRHGIVYFQGKAWTGVHDRWGLHAQHFTQPGLQLSFDIAYDTLLATLARRDRLDSAIAAMAADSEFTLVLNRLGCLRGISTLTAFGLAVEIGDWGRLTGRSIGAYLGLVPAEFSSGATRSQGSITKTGNGDARRLLIEAAWHHRNPNRVGAVAPPPRPRDPGRARPRATGQPPHACPVEGLRCPPQAARGGQTPPSPASWPAGAGRWPCSTEGDPPPYLPSLIVSHRSSVSTSFVLAALRALHVDTSHAPRTGRLDGSKGGP
jgi:transposase